MAKLNYTVDVSFPPVTFCATRKCKEIPPTSATAPIAYCMLQVYEQRAMPDPVNRNLDRSYHLAMSHRGMGAVEKVSNNCVFFATVLCVKTEV